MKLTSGMLRRIIAEEVGAAAPRGSFEDFEAGFANRAADRRWAALSKSFPKATARVGREAFDDEMAARDGGAAGGGGSYAGPAAEYKTLLDLLEET